MTHPAFVEAYRQGRLRVQVDRAGAARLVSARLLLPLILLPPMGLGVALALTGHVFWGIAVFLAALAVRFAVRASSQGFVLTRALQDPAFYGEVTEKQILRVISD